MILRLAIFEVGLAALPALDSSRGILASKVAPEMLQ